MTEENRPALAIPEKLRVIDGTTLKLIAIVSMTIDHIGAVFFPHVAWWRIVGRLAFPLFAFSISEGCAHTRSLPKYMLRLGIFALVSEIPFDLCFQRCLLEFGHQNVMLTFLLAVSAIFCCEKLDTGKKWLDAMLKTAVCGVFCVLAILLHTDYNAFGVGLVLVFWFLRRYHIGRNLAALAFEFVMRGGLQSWCMLSAVPLLLYNGKRGLSIKYLFYFFYPGHLLLLAALRHFLA